MAGGTSFEDARSILGNDALGPRDVEAVFGTAPENASVRVPFTPGELRAAQRAGVMLVLRVGRVGEAAPLTILEMIRRFPQAFDPKLLRQMGYQLKDDWGIELEPLADTDTCTPGWALVRKQILDATRNLDYEQQDSALAGYAELLGVAANAVRRRSAVEIVYDTLLYFGARKVRLLDNAWDWSTSRTVDGGYLNVGGFGATGIQILSYSRAVRHGALGICPTCQRQESES